MQGGDFEKNDGNGGYSIYGDKFEDENFYYSHAREGLLSMINEGKNTNGSQFFITLRDTTWYDEKHVVFGQVISGMDYIREIEGVKIDDDDKPEEDIVIENCGEIKDGKIHGFSVIRPHSRAATFSTMLFHLIHRLVHNPSVFGRFSTPCTVDKCKNGHKCRVPAARPLRSAFPRSARRILRRSRDRADVKNRRLIPCGISNDGPSRIMRLGHFLQGDGASPCKLEYRRSIQGAGVLSRFLALFFH